PKKGPALRRPVFNYALRVRTTRHPAQWSWSSLSRSRSWSSPSWSTWWMKTPTQPLVLPQIPAPTFVVSPPAPTTATGADCGTKMRLRLESAATECEPDDCGTVSIRTLVASITPSTAAWVAAVGQGAVVLQFLLEPV